MGTRPTAVVLWVLASLVAGGACGPRHGAVSGRVTVDGVPLDYGIVNFVTNGAASSAPVVDGTFAAGGVPLGTVRIAVRALPRPVVAEPAAADARPYAPLPDRYLSPEESGLTLDVRPGRQVHDIVVSGT